MMPMMDTANSLPPWDTTPPILLGRLHSGQQGEGWRCQDPPTVYTCRCRSLCMRACMDTNLDQAHRARWRGLTRECRSCRGRRRWTGAGRTGAALGWEGWGGRDWSQRVGVLVCALCLVCAHSLALIQGRTEMMDIAMFMRKLTLIRVLLTWQPLIN